LEATSVPSGFLLTNAESPPYRCSLPSLARSMVRVFGSPTRSYHTLPLPSKSETFTELRELNQALPSLSTSYEPPRIAGFGKGHGEHPSPPPSPCLKGALPFLNLNSGEILSQIKTVDRSKIGRKASVAL